MQAIHNETNKIIEARKNKIYVNMKMIRRNPDTSCGLMVTSALRAKARTVEKNRKDEQERKKAAKEVRAKLIEKRNKKKSDAFLRVKKEIQTGQENGDTIQYILSNYKSKEDIELTYMYCGGIKSKLKNQQRATFEGALVEKYCDVLTSKDE